jgi:hypothetical protein
MQYTVWQFTVAYVSLSRITLITQRVSDKQLYAIVQHIFNRIKVQVEGIEG